MNKDRVEDIKDRLWIEIMEDYLFTAELGHLARDEKAHKTEMREKLQHLAEFVCVLLDESYNKGINDGMKGKIFTSIEITEMAQISPELMKHLKKKKGK